MLSKISELELERNEHLLVEETLQPLDPHRRAFRLVGECLVERTVGEVLPLVQANRDHVSVALVAACSCVLSVGVFVLTDIPYFNMVMTCHS